MLGRYDRAMRARQVHGGQTLLARAIAAIKRNNGTLFYVPQNALGDGAPNLLSAPEFAAGLTDAPIRGGVITASTLAGYDGAIAFGHDGSTISYAYKDFATTSGLAYTISVSVKMDDGLAPTFGNATRGHVSNTFALVANNMSIDPSTYTVSLQSDGSYRVSGAITATSGASYTGVAKYATNNNRTFKVTGYKLELGSTATAYTPQSVLRMRGVFIDSAGVSPVTNIADVIGRMTDRTGGSAVATQATTASKPLVSRVPKRLGPNLVSNGDGSSLTGWTGSTGYSVASGAFKCNGATAAPILRQNVGVAQGKTYRVTFTQSGRTAGNSYLMLGGTQPAGAPNLIANQTYSFVLTATTTAGTLAFATPSGTYDGSFDNISVQEVLEWTNAMSFDGSNDFLQTGITTGNEGWICAGVTFGATSLQTVAASGSSNNSEKGVCLLLLNSTTLMGQASNGTIGAQPSMPITVNTPQVVSMGWSGAVVMVGVGNTESAPVALAGDMTGAQLLRFGNHQSSGWPMNGPMTAQVICPVLPSAADRAIIRRWIGSLQGQTL